MTRGIREKKGGKASSYFPFSAHTSFLSSVLRRKRKSGRKRKKEVYCTLISPSSSSSPILAHEARESLVVVQ